MKQTMVFRYCKNEVLLFMDDDVVVETSYFDLVKYFQQADVGAVSGTLQTR